MPTKAVCRVDFTKSFEKKRLAARRSSGFTLLEIITVMSILVILFMLMLVGMVPQLRKARDGKRKRDLHEIQRGLELYYDQHFCYPEEADMKDATKCLSSQSVLGDHMKIFPCDPTTKEPYEYMKIDCKTYALGAQLENRFDKSGTFIPGVDNATGGADPSHYSYIVESPNAQSLVFGPTLCSRTGCNPGSCPGACCPNSYECSESGSYCVYNTACYSEGGQ